jgi:peptidoglycan/LPS O-acetylase OafA/YrhL
MRYYKEIDGLRAIAVLAVIFYHANFSLFESGYVGVDIFFVISGFLITKLIYSEMQNKNFRLINFIERRVRRIFPALFLVLGFSVFFAYLILTPQDMIDFSKSLISVPLVISNFYFLNQSGYFDITNELRPLIHTWSLSVEEQFYLIFPVFCMFIFKKVFNLKILISIFIFIFMMSFSLNQILINNYPNESFYLLPTRIWEFFAGSILLLAQTNIKIKQDSITNQVGSFVGFLLIIFSIVSLNTLDSWRFESKLIPILGSVFVILFANQYTYIGKLLSNKFIVKIGLISYSSYLFHQPIFVFARNYFYFNLSSFHYLFLILLTLTISYLSWKYVEVPFRDKTFLKRKVIFQLTISLILLFVIIGAIGIKQRGFENRFDSAYIGDTGQTAFHEYIDKKFIDCFPEKIASSALLWEEFLRCKQSKVGTPEVILLGDSHAEHLFIGLAESLPKYNVAFYINGEAPFIDSPTFSNIFDELLNNNRDQTIFITMHYPLRFDKSSSHIKFKDTIKKLIFSGKKVFLVGDIPYYSKDAAYCRNIKTIQNTNCHLSFNEYSLQKTNWGDKLIEIKNELKIEYIEIDKLFCSSLDCNMTQGNLILYRDNNHLNIYGSRIVGDYLARYIG